MNVVFIAVLGVFIVVVLGISIYRLRRGGPGPQVNWVPRSLRNRVNEHFEKQGWQKPYDDNGDRNPGRDQL